MLLAIARWRMIRQTAFSPYNTRSPPSVSSSSLTLSFPPGRGCAYHAIAVPQLHSSRSFPFIGTRHLCLASACRSVCLSVCLSLPVFLPRLPFRFPHALDVVIYDRGLVITSQISRAFIIGEGNGRICLKCTQAYITDRIFAFRASMFHHK